MPYYRTKIAVGIFVILFTLLFAGLTYMILLKKGVFDEKTAFNAYTKSAEIIYVGMPIRYSGFEIGSITDITLTDGGIVHIAFSINNQHLKWVRRTTVLQLEKPLLGSPTINLLTSLDAPQAEPDATLVFIVRDDINAMIQRFEPVVKNLQNIAEALEILLGELASEKHVLFNTLKNMEVFSGRLVQERAMLTSLTGDDNATVTVTETIRELNAMVKELHANVVTPSGERMEQIRAILLDVQTKLRTLDGTVNAVGGYEEELIKLRGDVRTGMEKTNRLLDRVNTMMGEAKPESAVLP